MSCHSSRYRAHRIYAILCAFLFPIGIPSMYLLALLSVKHIISPQDVNVLANSVVTTARSEEKDFRRTDCSLKTNDRSEDEKSDIDEEAMASSASTTSHDTDSWKRTRLLAHFYLDEHAALEGLVHQDHLVINKVPDSLSVDKARLHVVGKELVLVTRSIHPECRATSFLFCDLRPAAWCYEMSMRLSVSLSRACCHSLGSRQTRLCNTRPACCCQ